jgi:hypothetical protein
MKKRDIKRPTTKMFGNSNNRILCETSASDLGDKLVPDNHNHKESIGRPIRLLCDNNHIQMTLFRWFVTQRDKVHFLGNTGILIELIMTYSSFKCVKITDGRISRKGAASYLKHSRKLPPQIQDDTTRIAYFIVYAVHLTNMEVKQTP